MANSGGGLILIGVRNDGTSSGADVSEVLRCDPADVTNKREALSGKRLERDRYHAPP